MKCTRSSHCNNDFRSRALELDNILVWEVVSDLSREYMISLQGYSDDNCVERVMVDSGAREAFVIGECQRRGFRVSFCSVACRMSEVEQEKYNRALIGEEFDECISELFQLETKLNCNYGYNLGCRRSSKGKCFKKRRF